MEGFGVVGHRADVHVGRIFYIYCFFMVGWSIG